MSENFVNMDNIKKKKRGARSITAWILIISLSASIVFLILYIIGSELSDESLYSLLLGLRYSSFLLCVCSFYKVLLNGYRAIFQKSFIKRFLKVILYLIVLAYGICMMFFESFIVIFSGGN